MKYIDWIKRRISSLTDTKVIDFPETHEMIERKVVTEQRRQKKKNKTCFEKEGKSRP